MMNAINWLARRLTITTGKLTTSTNTAIRKSSAQLCKPIQARSAGHDSGQRSG